MTERTSRGFFAELRRRNVIRMAGLYVVTAWLLVQVADTLLPIFKTPDWVLQAMVVILALGFLPALVFSWVFELTPDGLKREAELDPATAIGVETGRRMDRLFFAGLLALFGLIAADRFWPRQDLPDPAAAAATDSTAAPSAAAAPPADASLDANAIAVLPFVNMSSDAEQEYFSDGISEEILNVLARMPELQVAARTSSFSFKGGKQEIPQIAEALNVRLVLEGSVRKQGDRVRITAQLIDAPSGFHLWSETYDRKLEDIFAIQDEIALAIATALKLQIAQDTGAARSGRDAVQTAAHDRYLRALSLWQTRREKELWEAVALLREAIEIEPDYAEAHAGLALVYTVIAPYSTKIAEDEAARIARDHAEQALALDQSLPEPHASLGYLASGERRFAAAERLFDLAIRLGPSYATAHQWQAAARLAAGRLPEALASIERASVLDPKSGVIAFNHALALDTLGRYDEARARCEQAPAEVRDGWACVSAVATAALYAGDTATSREMNRRWVPEFKSEAGRPMAIAHVDEVFDALEGHGDRRKAARFLAQAPPQSWNDPDSPYFASNAETPPFLVLLGEYGLALDYLETWAQLPSSQLIGNAIMLPVLDPIRCQPRFVAVVERQGLHDPHAARVCRDPSP